MNFLTAMTKVGIPRALLYYQYYPMWRTFFEELGVETVLSTPTTKAMVNSGCSRMVAETCLPVKVFCGHALSLVDKCDYMFIPAIRSMGKRAYNCSKFLGLPDMMKAVIPECPLILDMDIDVTNGKRTLYQNIYSLGRHFTWNPAKVKKAAEKAWECHLAYYQQMFSQGLTPTQAIDEIFSEKGVGVDQETANSSLTLTVAVVGHPYLIYDDYINHRLIHRLQTMGARVLTPEMVDEEVLDVAMTKLVGNPRWTYEVDVIGAGGYYLEAKVDGVIGVIAFGCGPDSVMMDMVYRKAKRLKAIPFMCLTLDEHTADAGLVTRLEAFLDMVKRRRREQTCV